MEPITSKRRIPELDGLRGIAILMVLYWHYFADMAHPGQGRVVHVLEKVGSLTWTGVDLFFVLSGFLIGGILIDNRGASNLLSTFYVRRSLRIFPLYFVWIAAFAVLAPMLSARIPYLFAEPLPMAYYLTYMQNVGYSIRNAWGQSHFVAVTWSLAVEEQFYLLLPGLILFVKPKRLVPILALLIIAAPVIRFAFLRRGHDLAAYTLLPCRWDSLLMGVCGAMAVRRAETIAALRSKPARWLYLPFAVMGAVFMLWSVKPTMFASTVSQDMLYSFTALFSLWAVLIAVVLSPAILRSSLLMRVGSIAYGVYIFHQGVNGLMHGLFGAGAPQTLTARDYGLTAVSLIITFALAFLSFRYFESPLLKLGHRFRYGDHQFTPIRSRTR